MPDPLSDPNPPDYHATQAADLARVSRRQQTLEQLEEVGELRGELVARIRAAIASGSYETQAKIDAALDRLTCELSNDASRKDAKTQR